MIKIFFILGMGREANVVAVHKNVCSEGSTSQAGLERPVLEFLQGGGSKARWQCQYCAFLVWWFQG